MKIVMTESVNLALEASRSMFRSLLGLENFSFLDCSIASHYRVNATLGTTRVFNLSFSILTKGGKTYRNAHAKVFLKKGLDRWLIDHLGGSATLEREIYHYFDWPDCQHNRFLPMVRMS